MPIDLEEPLAAQGPSESHFLRMIGWLSVGITVAVVSIFVGHELRSRYEFQRRTPYDFYDHAGESEFGVGV